MADNIIIKITSEANLSDAQKQLADLTKQAEELNAEMANSQTAYENEVAAIKKLKLPREQEEEQLRRMKQEFRQTNLERKDQIKETNKSIKALSDQVKAYKTLNGESGKVVQQLRAMRERLMEMEDAGEFGTKAFTDLSIAAAQLEDQIGDTQQRIRTLASDTKNMDALMGLGDGLAGSFYIATSAAEVFGDEMEGLQKAFYKVQAAMSVVSGAQQVYNALQKDSAFQVVFNTAIEKLAAKSKDKQTASLTRNTKAWIVNGAATAGSSIKLAAHTVVTKLATVAQAALNAVIYANPFVLLAAAIAAATAAIVGFVKYNSEGAKAARDYEKASKELEVTMSKVAVGQAGRDRERQKQIEKTQEAEEKALFEARKRNASEVELAQTRAYYAKKNAEDTKKYNDEEIARNNRVVTSTYNVMKAAERRAAEALKRAEQGKKLSEIQKQAIDDLVDAQQKYNDAMQKSSDLLKETNEAQRTAQEKEQELAEARKQAALDLQQTQIDLMQEGAAKEIAQIKFNYKEKLKEVQKGTALYKALEAKAATEIQAVRDKYAEKARQTAIQNQKNLLTLMSQMTGTEEDYQAQLDMQKNILKKEADDQIKTIQAAVKRREMTEEEGKVKITAIRLQLQNDLKDVDDREIARQEEQAKRLMAIDVQVAEARKNALTGAESVEEQKAVLDDYYDALKQQVEKEAELERQAVNRSTDTQEVKSAKIEEINLQLQTKLTEIDKQGAEDRIAVDDQYLAELERAVTTAESKLERAQTGSDKLEALREVYDAQLALYDEQQQSLDAKYLAGLISYQEYKQQEFEIAKAVADAKVQLQQESTQAVIAGFETALSYIQQISDLAFEALGQNVQAEMDKLSEMYTTDAEEAKKNSNKKLITQEEYDKKEAALKLKKAKYDKTQALINAAINTALAITAALTQAPPASYVMAAINAAMGAAQIAVIAAKPLAQYAKGRKGGRGEYAIVGEKGAELMYVPQGASIVPHNKINRPETWPEYNVPKLNVPELPNIGQTINQFVKSTDGGLVIDYDKLGEAVARNIPKQQAVTVNVDRSGISVSHGGSRRTYLNTKYQGTWN